MVNIYSIRRMDGRSGASGASLPLSRLLILSRLLTLVTAAALAACSADVATGTADNAIYNGTYAGEGTLQRSPVGYASAVSQPTSVRLTLSTLGSDFSGTLTSALSSGFFTYTGDVSGRVTPSGGDFTYVQRSCQGTLHGSFVLNGGSISGSAVGRDCDAGGTGDNVRIVFPNLVRQ